MGLTDRMSAFPIGDHGSSLPVEHKACVVGEINALSCDGFGFVPSVC